MAKKLPKEDIEKLREYTDKSLEILRKRENENGNDNGNGNGTGNDPGILRRILEKLKEFFSKILDFIRKNPCLLISIGVMTTAVGVGILFVCPFAGYLLTAVGGTMMAGPVVVILSDDAHKKMTDDLEKVSRVLNG